jgi:eukaryotic-like serine/threonine-protein kinase
MPTIYTTSERIDHYQIMRPLGRGGASHVYLAQDWHALQEVVLKFPDDDVIGGAAVFERYKREAEIGRRLSHQYIQRHLNQGERRSAEYLVLEYMRGRTLRMVVEQCAPGLLPTEEVLRLLIQVCSALAYAHEHKVIHSNIKPENIMVLPNGEVKLLDFGIAFLEGRKRRATLGLSSPIGTPDYMAPERLQGKDGDARANIYAVGVVLYELLCRQLPFEEDNVFALITTHLSHDPPGILERNPALPPALATVVMRAIGRDTDKRHASMRDLLYDLCHLEEVRPVDYHPDPPRLGGRHRQAIRLSLIILVVLLGIIAFGIIAQAIYGFAR